MVHSTPLPSRVWGRVEELKLRPAWLFSEYAQLQFFNTAPPPGVVASGFDDRAGGDRFSESDIAAFVRKPYEPEELVDAVRDALQG